MASVSDLSRSLSRKLVSTSPGDPHSLLLTMLSLDVKLLPILSLTLTWLDVEQLAVL